MGRRNVWGGHEVDEAIRPVAIAASVTHLQPAAGKQRPHAAAAAAAEACVFVS